MGVALAGGEVNWLRQLQDPDLEASGLGDLDEENLNADRNSQNNRSLPCSGGAETEAHSEGGESDAEDFRSDIGRTTEEEFVLWVPNIIGHNFAAADLAITIGIRSEESRSHVEAKVSKKPSTATAKADVTTDTNIEHAIGIEEEASGEAGKAEKVEIDAKGDGPVVITDLDAEVGLDIDHFQNLNLT